MMEIFFITVGGMVIVCNIIYHCMTTEEERNEFENNK